MRVNYSVSQTMKLIAVILFVAAATASPLYGNEEIGEEFVTIAINEDFGEEYVPEPKVVKEEDWRLVPDTSGKLHMVDINAVDMGAEPLFDASSDVHFRLFTRSNPTAPQLIQLNNDAQLTASNFNPALPTFFHVHGWHGGGAATGANIRNAYINALNSNVFTVDWGVGAQTINYIAARLRVNPVGEQVANYINWIAASRGLPFSAVTVVGHSLGAHIAGAAGKRTAGLLGAVIALDPAGPLFTIGASADRVHDTDAAYVECQMTDAGRLGFDQPICQTNFYPNWGTSQPGCGIDLIGTCGHNLVEEFHEVSLHPANVFGATRCGGGFSDIQNRNCNASGAPRRMGGHPANDGPSPANSVFFLATNAPRPFAQGVI